MADVEKIKEISNSISPFFCTAKWLEGTLSLNNLTTQSCHHCKPHRISLRHLKKNAAVFFNTPDKKKSRRKMLLGKTPKECIYCHVTEKSGGISERFTKSSRIADPETKKNILECGFKKDIIPTDIEVSFSNLCNLKCAYCLPENSSSVYNDFIVNGPYLIDINFFKNVLSYIRWLKVRKRVSCAKKQIQVKRIFSSWLKNNLNRLKSLRVTGGEPLLSKECKDLLVQLSKEKYPDLVFSINTNLMCSSKEIDALCVSLKEISNNVREVRLYTTVDALGKKAEFIRAGTDFNLFEENVLKIISHANIIKFNYMITISLLNLSSIKEVLSFILTQRKEYPEKNILFSFSSVIYPKYLSPYFADTTMVNYFEEAFLFMKNNMVSENKPYGFSGKEIIQAESLLKVVGCKYKTKKDLFSFKRFVEKYSKRTNTDFYGIFSEYRYLKEI